MTCQITLRPLTFGSNPRGLIYLNWKNRSDLEFELNVKLKVYVSNSKPNSESQDDMKKGEHNWNILMQ